MSTSTAPSTVFSNLTVVELSSVLAGPAVGLFFAELGARVIKIENAKNGGDLTRHWKQPGEDPAAPASAYYHSVNWGKEVRFLDLTTTEAQQQVKALLQTADVLIVNFKPGDAARFDLENAQLRAQFPQLIIAQVEGYAHSARVAYDAVLQAETGFLSINGTPESGPLKLPVAFIDLFAAHQLKEGVLVALLQRITTGQGAVVTVTLEEAAIASLANQAANWLNVGIAPTAMGSLHPNIAPYGESFATADGRAILLAVGTDRQFASFCEAMGCAEWIQHPNFSTNAQRVVHRVELAALLRPLFVQRTAQEWDRLFEAAGVPAGIIRSIPEVFQTKAGADMVLKQQEADGTVSQRVRTAVFSIH